MHPHAHQYAYIADVCVAAIPLVAVHPPFVGVEIIPRAIVAKSHCVGRLHAGLRSHCGRRQWIPPASASPARCGDKG